MYNTTTYPMSYSFAAAPPRGGLLTYLRAASLAFWMFTLVVRFWKISNYEANIELAMSGDNAKFYFYVGFTVAFLAHLTLGPSKLFALPFYVTSTWSGRLITLFCVLELLVAPLSLTLKASMIYSVATWTVYAVMCLYWQSDYRIVQRMTVFAGMVVLAWMFILLLKHGLPKGVFGGGIGGINRNASATAALGAMICCMVSPNKMVRRAAVAAGLFMAVIVTSRGTMVAMAAFFAFYYVVQKGTTKAAVYAVAAFAMLGIIMLVSPYIQYIVLERILHMHDKARGIGSGFTGRVTMWQYALEKFWERPVLGAGFRSTTYSSEFGGVHSGYLKILVETGAVGATIIVGAVVTEFVRRLRLGIMFRQLSPAAAPGIDIAETVRINSVACGTIAMTLVIWVYEQLYINLGSMASVVFFLMMAAPAYITTQGVALRR